MTQHVVTAPYVTLKVKDAAGALVVREFYKDAVLPEGSDSADLKRLLGKGMLGTVEVDEPPAQSKPAPVLSFDEDGNPVRPDDSANKPVWVEYAVAMRGEGVDEATARAEAEATSKVNLIKQFS